MKRLTVYLKDYKPHIIFGPIFKLLEAIFELIVPIVMADIIDNGISKDLGVGYILSRGAIILALGVVGLCCSLICQYVASKCSQGYGTALRNDLFKHINSLSYKELDKFGTATLVNRLTADVNQLQSTVAMTIRLLTRSPFLVIGAIIMSMTINLKLSLVFIVTAPLISFVLYMIMSKSVPIYKTVQKKLDKVTAVTRENLSGVRVVRAFATQDRERKRFKDAAEELNNVNNVVGAISALLNPLTFAIINIAILAIIYFGGNLVNTGEMTQGEVIAFVNYMLQICLALIAVAGLVILLVKGYSSGLRVVEVLETKSSVTDENNSLLTDDENAPAVVFDNVSFRYGTGNKAINSLNMTACKGEIIGVIGGTGSGKSTLVNLLARFYDVSEGSIKIFGHDVKDYKLSQLREKISYVPQKAVLFSGSLRKNMCFAKKDASDEEIWKALEIAQADQFIKQKGQGLDLYVERDGRNFSGGQRQRLTIARALVGNPQILVLDDSSSALDFATDYNLRKAISANIGDKVVFWVSQRATSIKNADKIIVLDEGDVKGIGTHDTLFETCDVYREICLSQVKKEEHAR